MKRRRFIFNSMGSVLTGGIGLKYLSIEGRINGSKPLLFCHQYENKVEIYSNLIKEEVHVLLAADTHLWTDDERGDKYRKYSARMASAYHEVPHFETGKITNPQESFENILEIVDKKNYDLLALPGDIVSFPSEAAIDWVSQKLDGISTPYVYVAGNHDWHYEGMEGAQEDLRNEWIERRLKVLYQGFNPMYHSYEVGGVKFLAIDNSTYSISGEQLDFLEDQIKSRQPFVLLVHIPFYAPGRSVGGFGCAHPNWGAHSDGGYKVERRSRWPKEGHSGTTFKFYQSLFNADNVLGVFAGHIHRRSFQQINGVPQFVTSYNASGAFLDILLKPLNGIDEKLL